MIHPDTVDLLVFDVDGTLSVTIKPVYESIKRAFAVLDIPFTYAEKDIEQHLGKPAAEFYRDITPPGYTVPWQEMRARIAHEEEATFPEYGRTFPGVVETLQLLRQRGYKLAVYSNSLPSYFNTVIGALGIADCFDYRECIGENNLTKQQLVRRILQKFGNPGTAVIGDRIHDIEAARENNALSVGCLYGYGKEEPHQADITINSFTELADIFEGKPPVFEGKRAETDGKLKNLAVPENTTL